MIWRNTNKSTFEWSGWDELATNLFGFGPVLFQFTACIHPGYIHHEERE